jgi:hypothetical protein
MYDTLATILGLGQLTAADDRLQSTEKTLNSALKSTDAELPEFVEMLSALDDSRRKRR